jgi:hypothetical protein
MRTEDMYSAEHYEDTRIEVGPSQFDRLSKQRQQEEIELNYLAKILVEAYLDTLQDDQIATELP